MIWWLLLLWGILGLLATADIQKDGDDWHFRWSFDLLTDKPVRLLVAGPVVWLLLAAKLLK